MDISSWRELLKLLKVHGTIRVSEEQELKAYEEQEGMKLPASYRSYCLVFGAGVVADWYTLAVPRYDGRYRGQFDLASKTDCYHNARDWEEVASTSGQFSRTVIFGDDSTAALYFWALNEPTDSSNNEYSVYAM